ncbi:hypothetical protein, partial [Actinomadura rubrisoli]|uniref:hypothetical protein n=1 Tax=Actinomadura rubrisoli TaxID=2530368 RepID=UPI00140439D5
PGGGQPPPDRRHCTVDLASGGNVRCHHTFTEVIAYATGGRIADAPHSAAAAMADAEFHRRLNALPHAKSRSAGQKAGVVLSVEFEHDQYNGRSTTFFADHGCDGDADVDSVLPAITRWWIDTIISFQTYVECQANHFEHSNYGGARTGPLDSTRNIGPTMNDRTSSIQWS